MDKSSWYFRKCTGCDLELEVQDAKFKCLRDGGCERIYPYPEKRFHGFIIYYTSLVYMKSLSCFAKQTQIHLQLDSE